MTDEQQQVPWCRATIADGTVTLNPWSPTLIRGGPVAMTLDRLEAAGVVLVDLFADGEPGDEELTVRYVSHSPRSEDAEDVLVAWARTVGYRRIWLPGRVLDLDAADAEVGVAQTRCPTCRLEWRDDTSEFWGAVRTAGAFPGYCMACGGSLPEWQVVPAEAPAERRLRSAAPTGGDRSIA